MPVKDNARVKTTGRGEIEFVIDQSKGKSSGGYANGDLNNPVGDIGSKPDLDINGKNIGDGHGIFAGKNGAEDIVLEFKSLVAGAGIDITPEGASLVIRATGSGNGGGGNGGGGTPIGDGFDIQLGDVSTKGDGSWEGGALPLTNEIKVSDAIDGLNEILGKLIPPQPPKFPNGMALTVANQAGASPRLAQGFANPSSLTHGLTVGGEVIRIASAGMNSNVISNVGSGDSGVVSLNMNGDVVGSRTLTGTEDNGNYGGLSITGQADYPADRAGFWKSINVGVSGAASQVGVNSAQITHSEGGSTNTLYYVRDNMTSVPSVSAVSITELASGTVRYSSGIPHYNSDAKLRVAASMDNFSGQTYYGGSNPITVQASGAAVIASQSYAFNDLGITTPIPTNTVTATALQPIVVDVNGNNVHGFATIGVVGRNVNGASSAVSDTTATTGATPTTSYAPFNVPQTKVLVMRGAATGKIDEMSVPVTGLGSIPTTANASRVSLPTGDRPVAAAATWVSSQAIETHDAAVVAGVLMHDQTNYSTSFLPVGPNYATGRTGSQYATFEFSRASVSSFKIAVTGSYSGCFVRLVGVTDNPAISPNAVGGWLDASKAYDGSGVPAEAGDPDGGCAVGALMTGSSGTYTITFGPQTSSNATGNKIQVRFKLGNGQSITALSFTG